MSESSGSRESRSSRRSANREEPQRGQPGLAGLNEEMMELSVSPPRQRRAQSPWRIRTPPPPPSVVMGSGIPMEPPNTPGRPSEARSSGTLPRNHSSPSLVDTSPKVAQDTLSQKKSPPRTHVVTMGSPEAGLRGPTPRTGPAEPRTSAFRPPPAAELTPVTNNTTSGDTLFVDDAQSMIVSPDDAAILHGEHLAMPTRRDLKPRPSASSGGPPLPPMPMAERSKSVPSLEYSLGRYHYQDDEDDDDDDDDEEEDIIQGSIPPVNFPSRRQFYSFQSRRSYEQQQQQQQQQQSVGLPPTVPPYQPTREDLAVGIGADSVRQIFQPSFPLDERQYSIPSIHEAHHFHGSTTSYTDEEDMLGGAYDYDDEDDDVSLSSPGSTLYLPGDEAIGSAILKLGGISSFPNPMPDVVFRDAQSNDPQQQSQQHDEADDEMEEDLHKESRHKKRTKKNEKERKAYEWLRTVERAGPDVIAEAASSRFLTGGHRTSPHPSFRPKADGSPSPTLPASGRA